ncbi:MAG: EscU/YscU/HrcU family type III secretion system export apparatus switch protein [Steroidobacteraceae bacterium]
MSAEKTHKPTAKKLRDARKRGELVKSRELNSLALFIGLLAFLWLGAAFILQRLTAVLEHALTSPNATGSGAAWAWLQELQAMLVQAAWVMGPLLGIGLGCALLMGALQTRGVFSMTPITPKFERINPGQGLKNLFSTRQLFELAKMLVKTALLMGLLGVTIVESLDTLAKMVYSPVADVLSISGDSILTLMGWTVAIYALGAVLDYAHQHHEFMKQQKMSADELRREMRDTEGDAHVKARRRSTAREIAFTKALKRVASANVVVANPTHFCVALYYEPGETALPRVIAKGIDAQALRMRAAAQRQRVPVLEDPPLARKLFRDVPVDEYISDDLIDPVAAVFRWVRVVDTRNRSAACAADASRQDVPAPLRVDSRHPLAR